MKLAILGTDSQAVRLAAAAAAEGHQIAWIGEIEPAHAAAIAQLAPRLSDRAAEWELLLDHNIADAVLVGRSATSQELRAEQLKRLATEAIPLLIVHPAVDSVLAYYEVDMIRREVGGIVRHYNSLMAHPIVEQLAAWVRAGHPSVGAIHQVTCERRIADATRPHVLLHLARDVELLAAVVGHIRRVTAIGPNSDAAAEASFASLQVQMSTDAATTMRWSVGSPANLGPGLELTLIGEHGAIALQAPDDAAAGDGAWQLEIAGDKTHDRQTLSPCDAPRLAIEQFAAAVAEGVAPRPADSSTWDTATRAMEVVDAVELSLQKGRTIEVYQQQLTQRLAFRGAMAAVGCGLLLVAFAAIVVITVLGGAEGRPNPPILPSWPIILLVVLAAFLLLQAVPLLASKSKRASREAEHPRDS